MMKNHSELITRLKPNFLIHFVSFIAIYAATLIIGYYYSNGFTFDFIWRVTLFVILFHYVFFDQFELTELDIYSDQLILKYPFSIILKSKRILITDIKSISFPEPGPYGSPKIKLTLKSGKKKKFFSPDKHMHKELTKTLSELGVNIEN